MRLLAFLRGESQLFLLLSTNGGLVHFLFSVTHDIDQASFNGFGNSVAHIRPVVFQVVEYLRNGRAGIAAFFYKIDKIFDT